MARILYVEDNEDNVYMLSRRLQRRGHQVLVAGDGEVAIATAQAEHPELILMDLGLPVLDGWEAVRRLKGMTETKAIPVIGLSAHAMASDKERALAAGCDDFDTKPIDFDRLMTKVETLLKRTPRD